jgi:glycosyltransferase involved in cell wall biosynthesis
LATALQSKGVPTSVLFTDTGPMVAELRRRSVPVDVVAGPFDSSRIRIGGSLAALPVGVWHMVHTGWTLGGYAKRSGSTILVAESTKALLMGAIAARRARLPLIWHVHDRISAEYFGTALAWVIRLLGWLVGSGYIANSTSTLKSLLTSRKRAVVAYPGIEPVEVPLREPRPPAEVVIAMVGRLERWKGQDLLLRALAASSFRPSVTIVGGAHFGEDFGAELTGLTHELGLQDSVTFAGHVSDPTQILAAADIAVHCSRTTEPFGQVIVEAMGAGCAVIAANSGGPLEIVTDGVDGLLVDPTDTSAFTAALDALIGDPEMRREFAERARITARRFTIDETAEVVANFLFSSASDAVGGPRHG